MPTPSPIPGSILPLTPEAATLAAHYMGGQGGTVRYAEDCRPHVAVAVVHKLDLLGELELQTPGHVHREKGFNE